MADAIIEAPECARLGVTFYVVSPSAGLEAAVRVDGLRKIESAMLSGGLAAAISTLNGAGKVDDARAMTASEVVDYIHNQENEDEGEE